MGSPSHHRLDFDFYDWLCGAHVTAAKMTVADPATVCPSVVAK